MKKLLLGSLVLLLFSASIVLFNISCNKDSDAQPQQSNCANTATVIFTVNFPSDAPPRLGRIADNGIYFWGSDTLADNQLYSTDYYQPFDKVGSASKKVFTFNNVSPAVYGYIADIYGSNREAVVKSANLENIKIEGGKTYNITINSSDFD
jgi:hypothetical protein